MPRIKESTVYQFDELSEQAKERARQWYRECSGQDFADFGAESVIEDAVRMGELMGFNLRTRAAKLMGGGTRMEPEIAWSVGDREGGVSFSGSYAYAKGAVRKLSSEAPAEYNGNVSKTNTELNRIARELTAIQRRNFYQVIASFRQNPYSRTFGMDIDVERRDDRPISAEDVAATEEAIRDFATWIEHGLTAEWEYQQSDAYVDENIQANEYEFDEEGRRA